MSDDEQNATRIGRPRAPHGDKTYHGPVETKTRENNVQVITFTGSDGGAPRRRPHRPELDRRLSVPARHRPTRPPLHRLDLTVDLSNERH